MAASPTTPCWMKPPASFPVAPRPPPPNSGKQIWPARNSCCPSGNSIFLQARPLGGVQSRTPAESRDWTGRQAATQARVSQWAEEGWGAEAERRGGGWSEGGGQEPSGAAAGKPQRSGVLAPEPRLPAAGQEARWGLKEG